MKFLNRRPYVLLIFVVMMIIGSSSVFAQGELTRTIGLTGSLQNGQAFILIPLWVGDMLTVAPGFNVVYTENVGSTIGLVIAPRYYLQMNRIAPYISGQVGVQLNMPKGPGDTTDVRLGVGVGGEYFINPKFSFGVEAQINGMVTDVSGISLKQISTGTAVHANVYF